MGFSSYISKIEDIKKHEKNIPKQEEQISEIMYKISKVIVDSEMINEDFSKSVSPYLAMSIFKMINSINLDYEVDFITDSVGYGDKLALLYNDKKQVNCIKYQTSDEKTNISLRTKDNKVILSISDQKYDGSIREQKNVYKKDKDGLYYEYSTSDKLIVTDDGLTSVVEEKYTYDNIFNKLQKESINMISENNKTITKSYVESEIPETDFVIRDGKFYTIKTHKNIKKLKKVNELSKKSLETF